MQTNLFGDQKSDPLIMMSLHPQAFDSFTSGVKHYEFRKLPFIKTGFHSFIYVTMPVAAISAYAIFDNPIIGDADQLAKLAHDTSDAFQTWLPNGQKAAAYPLKSLTPITPMPLKDLKKRFPDFHPPQKFIYLERKADIKNHLLEHIPSQK